MDNTTPTPGSPVPSSACLCNALRQASRSVSRLYDDELRTCGLRTTQYSLLRIIARTGEVRQGDLSGLTHLDETTLTRTIRPLVNAGWLIVRAGDDRREKLVAITDAGRSKLIESLPAWERAQTRMQELLPDEVWRVLMTTLADVAHRTAAG